MKHIRLILCVGVALTYSTQRFAGEAEVLAGLEELNRQLTTLELALGTAAGSSVVRSDDAADFAAKQTMTSLLEQLGAMQEPATTATVRRTPTPPAGPPPGTIFSKEITEAKKITSAAGRQAALKEIRTRISASTIAPEMKSILIRKLGPLAPSTPTPPKSPPPAHLIRIPTPPASPPPVVAAEHHDEAPAAAIIEEDGEDVAAAVEPEFDFDAKLEAAATKDNFTELIEHAKTPEQLTATRTKYNKTFNKDKPTKKALLDALRAKVSELGFKIIKGGEIKVSPPS